MSDSNALVLRSTDARELAQLVAKHPDSWWRLVWPSYRQYKVIDSALGAWCLNSGWDQGRFAEYLERLLTIEYVEAPKGGCMAPGEGAQNVKSGLIDLDRGHAMMGGFSEGYSSRPAALPAPSGTPSPRAMDPEDFTIAADAIDVEWRESTGSLPGQTPIFSLCAFCGGSEAQPRRFVAGGPEVPVCVECFERTRPADAPKESATIEVEVIEPEIETPGQKWARLAAEYEDTRKESARTRKDGWAGVADGLDEMAGQLLREMQAARQFSMLG